MVSRDSSSSTVNKQEAFDQHYSSPISDQTKFFQQVSNSFPEFEDERKRCSQDPVSNPI